MNTQGMYIHLTWEGYKKSNSSMESINLQSQTRQTYLDAAAKSQSDIFTKLGMSATGLNKTFTEMDEMKNTWTTPGGQEKISKVLLEGVEEAIRAGLNGEKGSGAEQGVNSIFKSLNSVEEVIGSIPALDDKLSKYLKGGDSGSFGNVLNGNSISMISYDDSIISSLQKAISSYGKIKGEDPIKNIGNAKNGAIKQLVNTEINKALKEGLLTPLGVSDSSLQFKSQNVNKSGNGINIKCANDKFSINFAPKVNSQQNKGTISMFNLPRQMREALQSAALMDSAYEYTLLNLLAHNQNASNVSKFIAARAMMSSLPKGFGLNFISGLDRVITLSDLYNRMSSIEPGYTFNGASSIGPGEKIPGNPTTQALIRSSIQLRKLLNLSASLDSLN